LCFSGLIIGCKHMSDESSSEKGNVAYEYHDSGAVKSEAQTKNGKADGLLKNYSASGILESVYTYRMGIKEGPGVTYYPNGQAREKMFYSNGLREGTSKMYYRSGELYRTSPYSKGKMDGIRKTYYKDGTLMAEAPYKNGFAGLGLKEYNMRGEWIKDQTRISIEAENLLALQNDYVLILKLIPPQPGTIFYIGDLIEDKFLHTGLWPIEAKNNQAKYVIRLEKGGYRMETLTVSAQYRTDKSNYGVVTTKYNLAIDNK